MADARDADKRHFSPACYCCDAAEEPDAWALGDAKGWEDTGAAAAVGTSALDFRILFCSFAYHTPRTAAMAITTVQATVMPAIAPADGDELSEPMLT